MIPEVRIAIAVFAGLFVTMLLAKLSDTALVAAGIYPPDGNFLVATTLIVVASTARAIFTALGGWLAGVIGREFAMRAALILGAIMMLLNALAMVANWNLWHAANFWYPISLIVIAMPCCVFGGKISARFRAGRSAAPSPP